ncbi:MAG: hypothetical protein DRI69_08180 [Bacteroidetes bacterium]|nr:MAG: hypothetical protein DRI69_08180 [Bacteroidota bacterium]
MVIGGGADFLGFYHTVTPLGFCFCCYLSFMILPPLWGFISFYFGLLSYCATFAEAMVDYVTPLEFAFYCNHIWANLKFNI